jgi:hypothetical protein
MGHGRDLKIGRLTNLFLKTTSAVTPRQAKTSTQFNRIFLRPKWARWSSQMVIKTIVKAFCALCACVALATASPTFAQIPAPYHPGETISFSISFDGKDASKMTGAQAYFRLTSRLHDEQQAFSTQLGVTTAKPISPGVFEISIVIPPNMATGTYSFFQANTGTPDVGFVYNEGLPILTVTIENSSEISKPAFKSIKETSKP